MFTSTESQTVLTFLEILLCCKLFLKYVPCNIALRQGCNEKRILSGILANHAQVFLATALVMHGDWFTCFVCQFF